MSREIDYSKLGELKIGEIPTNSSLHIINIPFPKEVKSAHVWASHDEADGSEGYLSVTGDISVEVTHEEMVRTELTLRRAFGKVRPNGNTFPKNPLVYRTVMEWGAIVGVGMELFFADNPETSVRHAIAPFIDGFNRFVGPQAHIFLCHASEDKTAARELATAIKNMGPDIWFDEWEIKVGDSIVQKINDALGDISHLILIMSKNSVPKPWVRKELSSALMRQLSNEKVSVLPLLLEDCEIPPILADIKYADARNDMGNAISQIELALSDFLRN
jgi:hypothetical protein